MVNDLLSALGGILEPLDYPRQALANLVRSPFKAMETGDASHLIGALPGLAGGALGAALAGPVGMPLGILAGSLLGGGLQGIGKATGAEQFNAPTVQDITGTEDFLPNLAVGALTDPLTYAGAGGAFRAGKSALAPLAARETTPLSGLMAPRRSFAMAKDVHPITGEIGSLVGGDVQSKVKAARLADEMFQATQKGDHYLGMFDTNRGVGAVFDDLNKVNTGRHETIHGIIDRAAMSGDTQGLPMMMKIPAKLHEMTGYTDPGFLGGLADFSNELAAQSLENRGLMNQLKGGYNFLFNHPYQSDYAKEFAMRSPLIGSIYGNLPYVPKAAKYGGLGLGAAGAGKLGYDAYANREY